MSAPAVPPATLPSRTLHTTQYSCVHLGHCSLRFAGSHANMYVHPGVGQHLRAALALSARSRREGSVHAARGKTHPMLSLLL